MAQTVDLPAERWRADFPALIERHQAMVFGIAVHFLRNRTQAEDIAQDVFLELYKNAGRIESDSHAVHWLRKVTARKCIDHIRWRRLRPWHGLDEIAEPAAPGGQKDLLLSRGLQRMVASLPGRMRMAVVLRFQEDLAPAEIAAVMDTTTASAKSMVHRGLELLREKMQRAGVGG
ncbi:MAG: RNA polymerase sigma factor [Candidatus Solibacter usitatus]|nr:RNA polymerase sigma factor [Candidatus Solibacter usitatus]